MTQGNYSITKKAEIGKNIFDFTIHCPEIAKEAVAGQFVHIKVEGFFLRRPISICEIDKTQGTIRIVFEIKGDGTKSLSELEETAKMDVIGPLGNNFTLLDKSKKIIVVGGGIGVPPMLETAKPYGENATAIIGFRNSDAVVLKDDFVKYGSDVMLCTDDGSEGIHGYVTTALEQRLAKGTADIIYACGPEPMLKGIAKIAKENGIRCEISMEERMACGVGACLVCACKTVKDGEEIFSHVCKDGPIFSNEQLIMND